MGTGRSKTKGQSEYLRKLSNANHESKFWPLKCNLTLEQKGATGSNFHKFLEIHLSESVFRYRYYVNSDGNRKQLSSKVQLSGFHEKSASYDQLKDLCALCDVSKRFACEKYDFDNMFRVYHSCVLQFDCSFKNDRKQVEFRWNDGDNDAQMHSVDFLVLDSGAESSPTKRVLNEYASRNSGSIGVILKSRLERGDLNDCAEFQQVKRVLLLLVEVTHMKHLLQGVLVQ